ncbi:MAG TPA: hypothetical protein VK492_05515 [Chitinophagaceae bacterium]|nr:hypothetical protein [Chitinophagaceae bacterium]
MRSLLLLFIILIGYTDLCAQDSTFVTIKTGQNVKDVLTTSDIYHYPQFTNGKVFLRDGSMAIGKMNYNRLYGQMLFINPIGDTLALADEKNIKFIVIDRDTFYYDGGYLRLMANSGVVKLTQKQIWVLADIRKIGTHNRPTTTVAVTSFSSYTDGRDAAKSKDLIMNEDVVLRKETQYYFGDKYNLFVPASKKGLLQLFPKEQQEIDNYLKENKVNFNKKDDVEKLYQFLLQFH